MASSKVKFRLCLLAFTLFLASVSVGLGAESESLGSEADSGCVSHCENGDEFAEVNPRGSPRTEYEACRVRCQVAEHGVERQRRCQEVCEKRLREREGRREVEEEDRRGDPEREREEQRRREHEREERRRWERERERGRRGQRDEEDDENQRGPDWRREHERREQERRERERRGQRDDEDENQRGPDWRKEQERRERERRGERDEEDENQRSPDWRREQERRRREQERREHERRGQRDDEDENQRSPDWRREQERRRREQERREREQRGQRDDEDENQRGPDWRREQERRERERRGQRDDEDENQRGPDWRREQERRERERRERGRRGERNEEDENQRGPDWRKEQERRRREQERREHERRGQRDDEDENQRSPDWRREQERREKERRERGRRGERDEEDENQDWRREQERRQREQERREREREREHGRRGSRDENQRGRRGREEERSREEEREREERQHGGRGRVNQVETRRTEQEQSRHNPYYFHEQRFQSRLQSDGGQWRVLEKFSERSELLKGIKNQRLAILEARPQTFIVPHHLDAECVLLVVRGKATVTTVVQEKKETRKESYNVECGDVMTIPAGTTVYLANHENEDLQIVKLIQPVNNPGEFKDYLSAGGEAQAYYSIFSNDVLEAALNIPRDRLERIFKQKGEKTRGKIIRASQEQLRALSQRATSVRRGSRGTRAPIKLESQTPLYSNQYGQMFEACPDEFPQLRRTDVAASIVNIKQGGMMVPHFNSRATWVVFVSEGDGYFEMACPHVHGGQWQREGEREERSGRFERVAGRLSQGGVLVIPAGHPIAIMASSNENLRLVGFGINAENNKRNFLAGRENIMNEVDREAKELAFNIEGKQADEIFKSQRESFFTEGPKGGQQRRSSERSPLMSILKLAGYF